MLHWGPHTTPLNHCTLALYVLLYLAFDHEIGTNVLIPNYQLNKECKNSRRWISLTFEEVLIPQVTDTQSKDGQFVKTCNYFFLKWEKLWEVLKLLVQPVSVPFRWVYCWAIAAISNGTKIKNRGNIRQYRKFIAMNAQSLCCLGPWKRGITAFCGERMGERMGEQILLLTLGD